MIPPCIKDTAYQAKIFSIILLFLGLWMQGCATTKMAAIPGGDATVTPNGTFSIVEKEGVTISAAYTKTPYSINAITTFYVEVYNNTDQAIEFLPKPYLLFDETGAQYMAMGPNALAEASMAGSYRNGYYSMGFGYGHPFGWGHSHSLFYSYPGYYDPPFSGRTYQGMIAKALPVYPMTVHPRAKVFGNVYFPVRPKRLEKADLVITRMTSMPINNQPAPREVEYRFAFDVMN